MKRTVFFIGVFAALTIIFLMITNPSVCKDGAIHGLLLSSNVIIPSIFPFSVFVLLVLKSNFLNKITFLNNISQKLFGLNSDAFSIFILSLIGGYPIGAKVLNQAVELKKIDNSTAKIMLNYSVNAGPAFIILAVGSGILNSKKIGYILFISHILASVLLCVISKKDIKLQQNSKQKINFNIIENFVLSVSESASATLSICSFVVIFSVILNYINYYSDKFLIFKRISYLLEVTNAVTQNKNVVFVSFLLGFAGICVWFQVFSQVKKFKINYLKFIVFRFLQGLFSSGFTLLLIKIFKISAPTLSNGINAKYHFTDSSLTVAISLIIMGIIFIISLYCKNYTGNLLEDLV